MAFMVPVMKNNYDIYKDNRSRKTSECSTTSAGSGMGNGQSNGPTLGRTQTATGGMMTSTGKSLAMNGPPQRKSKSYANMPPHSQLQLQMHMQMQMEPQRLPMPRSYSHKVFPKHGQQSKGLPSTKSFCDPKSMRPTTTAGSSNSNRKDLQQSSSSSSSKHQQKQQQQELEGDEKNEATVNNHSDLNKFHVRLLDKLRRSFSRDNGGNRP